MANMHTLAHTLTCVHDLCHGAEEWLGPDRQREDRGEGGKREMNKGC